MARAPGYLLFQTRAMTMELSFGGQALEFDEFARERVVDSIEPRAELVVPAVAVAPHPLCLGRLHPGRQHGVVLLADRALPRLHVRHVVEPGGALRSGGRVAAGGDGGGG